MERPRSFLRSREGSIHSFIPVPLQSVPPQLFPVMRRKSARKIAGASKPAVARAARAKRGASRTQSDRCVAQPAGDGMPSVSEADAAAAAKIMDDIRILGRKPLRVRGAEPHKRHEKNLAARFTRAKGKGIFTTEQLQEVDSLGEAGGVPPPATLDPQHADELVPDIRSLETLPRRLRGDEEAQQPERTVAQPMTNTKKKKRSLMPSPMVLSSARDLLATTSTSAPALGPRTSTS